MILQVHDELLFEVPLRRNRRSCVPGADGDGRCREAEGATRRRRVVRPELARFEVGSWLNSFLPSASRPSAFCAAGLQACHRAGVLARTCAASRFTLVNVCRNRRSHREDCQPQRVREKRCNRSARSGGRIVTSWGRQSRTSTPGSCHARETRPEPRRSRRPHLLVKRAGAVRSAHRVRPASGAAQGAGICPQRYHARGRPASTSPRLEPRLHDAATE